MNEAKLYRSVGELVEIQGVADADEPSEDQLNEIINFVNSLQAFGLTAFVAQYTTFTKQKRAWEISILLQ